MASTASALASFQGGGNTVWTAATAESGAARSLAYPTCKAPSVTYGTSRGHVPTYALGAIDSPSPSMAMPRGRVGSGVPRGTRRLVPPGQGAFVLLWGSL